MQDISDNLGRETIDSFNTSGIAARRFLMDLLIKIRKGADDTGRNSSYGRWEMYFAATRCASLSDKYDITKHPNYKYLSDFDKKTLLT